jgi:hypothetical protein
MQIVNDWIENTRQAPCLVEIDATSLIENYGGQAFWIARERQKHGDDHLRRGSFHWRCVAYAIARRHGIFGVVH